MVHTTLVPQLLEKSDEKYDYHTISRKFVTIPWFTKSSPTTPKASPTSTPNWWTTQDIINESLCKSKCKKYLYYQERWKEYCAEKNIVYDSPAVEQFLTFLTELLYQGVSDSVLISAKSAVAHVLKMKYQHISQQPSVIKYLKGWFNLRTPLRNISFVWDV